MTTQNQVIAFCVLAFLAVPLGGFVAIKTINKCMRPPINTLTRHSGDIELVEQINPVHSQWDIESVGYIQPTQPLQTYYPRELFDPIHERILSLAPSYETGALPPSYGGSGTIPSYQSIINCCLENENIINLDIIIWLITFFAIRLVILWITYKKSTINFSIILPFSTSEVSFLSDFSWKIKKSKNYPKIWFLRIQRLGIDLSDLLDSLEEGENFSLSLTFTPSEIKWRHDKSKAFYKKISEPIIINKNSDPILINNFIIEQLDSQNLFISNWLKDYLAINLMDPLIISVISPIEIE